MTQKLFEIGKVYFMVTSYSFPMKYPTIESFVYLGFNLSDEDQEDCWYFQSCSDFERFGSALEGADRPVYCPKAEEVVHMLNIDELCDELKRCELHKGE